MLQNRFLYWMDKLYGLLITIGSNLQSVFLLYMRLTWGHQFILMHHSPLVTICGALLMVGFASRLVVIPLFCVMAARLELDIQYIIDPKTLSIADPYPFLITTFLIFCFGPGRVSLDAWIKRWISNQPKY